MASSGSERDTQFAEWAHLLLLQLADENALALNWDRFFGELELTISRRTYDLAMFIVSQAFEDELVPKDILYKNGKPVLMYPENLKEWYKEKSQCQN